MKCRLINPAKTDIGLLSKNILDRINSIVRKETGFLQWRNTGSVIDWFKSIDKKENCKFLKFDIADFYPSISKDLLLKSLKFARRYTAISKEEEKIIFHAKKSFLFSKDGTWSKKNGRRGNFDVTMGSYDGSETAEIVGLFLLNDLSSRFGISNVGLYRDDGLAVLKNASGPEAERARKDLFGLFKEHDLKITADTNLIGTDFLDIYLDLKSGKYRPWHKENDVPMYVHAESNHPPVILKRVPDMIEKRVSSISYDKKEFNKSKKFYENALKKSGFTGKMSYQPKEEGQKTQKRRRKIIWFNPPFSKNVRTNVGKMFIKLVKKHFPPHHKLHKIFNKNNMKVSYSCMDNLGAIIKNHNSAVLKPDSQDTNNSRKCNCRVPQDCPLRGECLEECVVYKATVRTKKAEKFYVGVVEGDFKGRWNNHMTSFRKPEYEHKTSLSSYMWSQRDAGEDPKIEWEILKQTSPYRCGGRSCNLCALEKIEILEGDKTKMLNDRSEILAKCRHKSKFLLKNLEEMKKFENG